MTCLLYWLTGFREDFKTFFPIGSHVKTTVCLLRWPFWMEVRVTGHNFENWPRKDHPCHVCFKLAYWFQRRFLNIFPIGSYVITMSADGGHLGWRSGSLDIILKVDHLRTIHAMFALNWLAGFRGEDLLNIFSIGSYFKIKSSHGGHLEFPISKRFTSLVHDHRMIIPAKSQFNWLSGF
jgi:hypothetical protein